MERLTIIYDGHTLVDCDVDEFGFSKGSGAFSVTARVKAKAAQSSGKGMADILGALAGAQKQKTAKDVERRRHALEEEKAADD